MIQYPFPKPFFAALAIAILVSAAIGAYAQEKKPTRPQRPTISSPEVLQDGRVIFRILAPEAKNVGLQDSDIPGDTAGRAGIHKR